MMLSPAVDAPPPREQDERRVALEFAAWMTGSRRRGVAEVEATERAGEVELIAVLTAIVHVMTRRQRHETAVSRKDLDDLLRSDPTVAVGLDHPLVEGKPHRLRVLQAELRRACLSTTLRTLPVAPRAAFVLLEILRLPFEQVAAVFGSTSAARTAHSRAMRQLEDYLGARCEHVDPANACRCATRLGVALDQSFVTPPADDVTAPEDPPSRRMRVEKVYARLPPPTDRDAPK